MPRVLIIIYLSIALLISIVPTFGQLSGNSSSPQSRPTRNDTEFLGSNLLHSELSAAVLSPCSVVGTTSGNFDALIYVTVTGPSLNGSPTYALITWGSGTCTTATTCTIIFQNPPPGPAQVGLGTTSAGATSSWMDVSGSPLVIFKNDTGATNWFPAGGPNTYLYMFVQAVGQWYSSEDKTKASGYPTLQWQPGTVTIIYQ